MGGTASPVSTSLHANALKTIEAIKASTVDPATKSTLPKELGIGELLQWLGAQLESSDRAIRAQMTALSSAKDHVAALASIKTELEALKASAGDPKYIPADSAISPTTIVNADWYKSLEEGSPIKKAVDGYIAKCNPAGGKLGFDIKGDDIKAVSDTLTDEIGATTTRNEMDMIKLQAAISARGQLIQMISNMTASFNETLKNVAANIRA